MPDSHLPNPYDFVPLEGNPKRSGLSEGTTQEAIRAGLYTGRLVCHLATETPLYIHGEGAQGVKSGSRPFFQAGGQPRIPASALKGIVRSVAEVVADGCLSSLSERAATGSEVPPGYSPCHHVATCCPTCALFGMVETRSGDQDHATPLAGRVTFGPARPLSQVRSIQVRMPGPRGGPKPTHRSFYFDPKTNRLLGRKFYYHHGSAYRDSLARAFADLGDIAKPITLDAVEGTFAFQVRFLNLTAGELGLLVYSLVLEDDLRHHLGFAKPYGLGTVRITIHRFELTAFVGPDDGCQGPARFLHYDAAGLDERGDAAAWQAQGLRDWQSRPHHSATYESFKEIYRWPRNDVFAYPSFQWFRGQRGARPQTTLAQYQGRAGAPPPTPAPTGGGQQQGRAVMPPPTPLPSGGGQQQGTIKWFSDEKSYGFISAANGQDFFVHSQEIDGYRPGSVRPGDRFRFEAEQTAKGWRAVRVVRAEGGKP